MTGSMPSYFLIEPHLPDTFSREELDELAQRVRKYQSISDARVAFSGDQIGAGPDWLEIINIWIPLEFIEAYIQSGKSVDDARSVALQVISGLLVNWLRDRPDKRAVLSHDSPPKPEAELHPKRIGTIYGPDGRVLQTVQLDYPYENVKYSEVHNPEGWSRKPPPSYSGKWPPKPPFSNQQS